MVFACAAYRLTAAAEMPINSANGCSMGASPLWGPVKCRARRFSLELTMDFDAKGEAGKPPPPLTTPISREGGLKTPPLQICGQAIQRYLDPGGAGLLTRPSFCTSHIAHARLQTFSLYSDAGWEISE